jgi:hypothetical protein
MAIERYSNRGQTTISQGGGITSGDTSVTVASSASLPSAGTFRIVIESEICACTGVAGNVLTIVRAQEGTTAAAHPNGATITQVLTNQGLLNVGSQIHGSDTYTNRPAVGDIGRLYLPTDGFSIDREDGTTWSSWGPVNQWTPPVFGDFSWVNQTSNAVTATSDTTHGGIYINAPAQSGGESPRILEEPVPGATPWTVTAHISPLGFPANFWEAGLRLRESSSGKAITFGFNFNATLNFSIDKFNADFTYNSTYGSFPSLGQAGYWASPPHWFQISDNGTSRIMRLSSDGQHWLDVLTGIGNTDFITANRIGFFANSINASHDCGITLNSWKVS